LKPFISKIELFLSEKRLPVFYKLVFLIGLIVLSVIYNYHSIISYPPQSIHYWRQADCTSIALMYAENGMNFFKPETHNLNSDKRTTGYGVGEFPIIYYIAGGLYQIFGSLNLLLRGINLLLFFIGLFYLFRLVYFVSEDYYWAILLPLLIFTSPLVIYYANNFLPESPSLALVFIGWYFFFKMRKHFALKYLTLSVLFFSIASLLKVTSGMNLVAILAIWVLEALRILKFKKKSKLFGLPFKSFLIILSGFVVNAAWYLFALWYNGLHRTKYFRTGIKGYWQMSQEEVGRIFEKFTGNWKFFLFNDSMFFLLAFILILLCISYRRKLLLTIIPLLIAGCFSFLVLWFGLLFDHDYYFLPLMVLPALLLVSFAEIGSNSYSKIFKNYVVKAGFVVLLLINLIYAHRKVDSRYSSTEDKHIKKEMFDIRPFVDSLGIEKSDKVICTRDGSPNHMLYLLNRRGWTDFNNAGNDSLVVVDHIKNDAKYLIVYKEIPIWYDILHSFIDEEIGRKDSVFFYRLKSYDQLVYENQKRPPN